MAVGAATVSRCDFGSSGALGKGKGQGDDSMSGNHPTHGKQIEGDAGPALAAHSKDASARGSNPAAAATGAEGAHQGGASTSGSATVMRLSAGAGCGKPSGRCCIEGVRASAGAFLARGHFGSGSRSSSAIDPWLHCSEPEWSAWWWACGAAEPAPSRP